jgi:hypothetical protein
MSRVAGLPAEGGFFLSFFASVFSFFFAKRKKKGCEPDGIRTRDHPVSLGSLWFCVFHQKDMPRRGLPAVGGISFFLG